MKNNNSPKSVYTMQYYKASSKKYVTVYRGSLSQAIVRNRDGFGRRRVIDQNGVVLSQKL